LNKEEQKCRFCGEEKPCPMEVERIVDHALRSGDYLIPSTLDNVMKWVCLISVPVFFILGLLFAELSFVPMFLIATGISVFSGIWAGYPKIVWSITKHSINVHAVVKDPEPTALWSFRRKAAYWVFYGIATSLFFFTIFFSASS